MGGGSHVDPSFAPRWVAPASLAETCRDAGLLFLEGASPDWWGEIELAAWLAGPYRDATRWGGGGRPSTRGSVPPPPAAGHEEADGGALRGGERLDLVLAEARTKVLAALRALALPGGSHAWLDALLAAGHVVPRADGDGSLVWGPVDLPGMRLHQRVEALFAADHLARPRDYAIELVVCGRCETVIFDPEARARGDCGAHVGYASESASRVRRRPGPVSSGSGR
jgi:hypothetical protein